MKKNNKWNDEITITISQKKIFLQSFVGAFIITALIFLRAINVIIAYSHYMRFIIPMFLIILFAIYLVVLAFYVYIVVKNIKK